jgi:hypothetical protein
MNVKKTCDFPGREDLASCYASPVGRAVLGKDEASLNEGERDLRRDLEKFELHYFECEECFAMVQEEQQMSDALERLDAEGRLEPFRKEARRRPLFANKLLALAASIFLFSTLSLSLWVYSLKQEMGKRGAGAGVETVSRFYSLPGPSQLGREEIPRIPYGASFLLVLDASDLRIPEEEMTSFRFEAAIADARKVRRWEDREIQMTPSQQFLVRIGPRFLEPGEYSVGIRAVRRNDGSVDASFDYPFIIMQAR